MDLKQGDRFGDFEVICVLGAGGMGQVYKVRSINTSTRIEAMKILLSELASEPMAVARFKREIETLALLDHENIAKLYSAPTIDQQLVMLMEFVDGHTLYQRTQQLAGQPMDVDEGLGYITQALAALKYAHSLPQPVIHRDIKPENLMITKDRKVKVMDFGIAMVKGNRRITRQGALLGTLDYMSPEQMSGNSELVDERSDLYSMGVVLYEVLAGRLPSPFPGDASSALYIAEISKEMNAVLVKALAKEPAQRFQNAQQFLSAIEAAQSLQPVAQRRFTLQETFTLPANGAGHAPPRQETDPPQVSSEPVRPAPRRRHGMSILAGSLAALSAGAMLFIAATEYRRGRPAIVDPSSIHQEGQPAVSKETTQPASPATQPAANLTGAESERKAAQTASVPGSIVAPAQPASGGRAVLPPKLVSANALATAQTPSIPPDLEERFIDLQARAASANSRWNAIREQNAKENLGLRQDVSQALARTGLHLEQARAALHAGDAPAAKRSMDSLEGDLNSLDKAAGR